MQAFIPFLLISALASAVQAKIEYKYDSAYPYAVWTPDSGSGPWPVVLGLHGSGSAAGSSSLTSNVFWDEVGFLLSKFRGGQTSGSPGIVGKQAIVVLPLTSASGSERFWEPSSVEAVVKAVFNSHNVKENELHCAGYSMGSKGIIYYATEFPDRCATITASAGFNQIKSGMSEFSSSQLAKISGIKTRLFAGSSDDKQPPASSAQPLLAKMKSAGADDVTLKVYDGADHGAMGQKFPWTDEAHFTWMLAQSKSGSSSSPSPATAETVKATAVVAAAESTATASTVKNSKCNASSKRSRKVKKAKRMEAKVKRNPHPFVNYGGPHGNPQKL